MEKRLLIALVLAAIVIIVSQKIFPSLPTPSKLGVDTLSSVASTYDSVLSLQEPDSGKSARTSRLQVELNPAKTNDTTQILGKTLTIVTSKATYHFTSIGAVPSDVVLNDYHVMPRASNQKVTLGRPHTPLLSYALLKGKDTIDLSRTKFAVDSTGISVKQTLVFNANVQKTHVTI